MGAGHARQGVVWAVIGKPPEAIFRAGDHRRPGTPGSGPDPRLGLHDDDPARTRDDGTPLA